MKLKNLLLGNCSDDKVSITINYCCYSYIVTLSSTDDIGVSLVLFQ